jgi:transcriptional regulator with XRE-family HTH domain
MSIDHVTKTYRKQERLTLEAFGERLVELLSGYSFTRQAVSNWERGAQTPDKSFLLLCAMRYGDWRRSWALDCLAVLQPEVFAPATNGSPALEAPNDNH